jgi:decaprenylphospho-beta-D-erythro-pentofuranosid-2-ulose 2-reductase
MAYVLIVGAKSDIAKAIARVYANNGYDLYLAARNSGELKLFSNDLCLRTQRTIRLIELDILDFNSHQKLYDHLEEKPEGVIFAVGYQGKQQKAQNDFFEAKQIIDTNYSGILSLLNIIANDFEQRKSGWVVGISSVAGDRGRKSNYMYGSAKAGLSAYLSGLRNRLYDSGVAVLTVKPGFVHTKMTEGMDLPSRLTAKPKEVAKDIYKAQQKRNNVLYSKWVWKYIMLIIKRIPEWKFKKMNI